MLSASDAGGGANAKSARACHPSLCEKGRRPKLWLVVAEVLDELRGVDGFWKEFEGVTALAGAGENFDRGGLSAEKNDAGVGTVHADGNRGFDTIDLRHEDVGEDEVGAVTASPLNRLFAAVRGFGDEAIAIEDLNNGIGDDLFVVDDEDSRGRALLPGFIAGDCRGIRAVVRGAAAEQK